VCFADSVGNCVCYYAEGVLAAEAPRMEKDELKAKLGNPEVVVIDVRSYTDWLLSGTRLRVR